MRAGAGHRGQVIDGQCSLDPTRLTLLPNTPPSFLLQRQDVGSVAGDIYYGGVSEREVSQQWLGERTAYLRQFGMATISQLTAWENLCYAAALRIGSDWEYALHRIADVTRLLGLSSFMNTPVGTELDSSGLSGGQRRKLAVAIELLKDPDVLFLDELTSGLDAKTALGVILQLGHLAHAGKTIVLSIHQPRLEVSRVKENLKGRGRDQKRVDPGGWVGGGQIH